MLELALFPLRSVLFPGGILQLKIFEQRYLDMTKVCIRDEIPFGVCLIRDGAEVGAPALPYATGCTARIVNWEMPHLGLFELVCHGEQVLRILEHWISPNGLVHARVDLHAPAAPLALPGEYTTLGELLAKIVDKFGAERFPDPVRLDDADWVACRLAEILPVELEFKQKMLELNSALDRLALLSEFLSNRTVVI